MHSLAYFSIPQQKIRLSLSKLAQRPEPPLHRHAPQQRVYHDGRSPHHEHFGIAPEPLQSCPSGAETIDA